MPRTWRRRTTLGAAVAALAALVGYLGATADGAHRRSGPAVVAAENVWGSVASQIAGGRLRVASVIRSPAADPHDYEPTAVDARAVADARLLVVNGAGYDPWASSLAAASPDRSRIVLDVGDLVGVRAGGNPHRWYSPADVRRVVRALAEDYARLDPAHAAFYRARAARFEAHGLARYTRLIASIRRRYGGVRVGASESVFTPLAHALGLALITPPSFLKAIAEGTEPTAADTATIGRQLAQHRVKVWVVNTQNATPDVTRMTDAARAAGIPVVTITETLSPASTTFEAWQVRQLRALAAALGQATAR